MEKGSIGVPIIPLIPVNFLYWVFSMTTGYRQIREILRIVFPPGCKPYGPEADAGVSVVAKTKPLCTSTEACSFKP